MPASQVIQPTQQSQVATRGQQQQPRGQPTTLLVVDNQQAEPSRPLTFTLTPTLQPFLPGDMQPQAASPPTATNTQQEHQQPPDKPQPPVQSADTKQQEQ